MNKFTLLENNLKTLTENYQKKLGKKEELENQLKKNLKELQETTISLDTYDKTKTIIQKASIEARDKAKTTLEKLISKSLQMVFGDNIKCEIEFSEKPSKVEAHVYIVSDTIDGQVKVDPLDARGGGVVDIVALTARLAEIELFNDPTLQGTIFLDEPSRNLNSDEYKQSLSAFLSEYSRNFNRQIIVITQDDAIIHSSDKAFEIQQIDGISSISPLKGE